jgi:L-arabinose isomerase
MQRGLGYAGEGDVLTAALVGALQRSFGQTTFTEIFCPDWVGNSLFLSHMGEVNPQCAQERPLLYEKEFPFTPAQNPVTLACAIREGPATFVNLAPGPEGTWNLIVAPVEMLGDGIHPDLRHWIRGWMQPQFPITDFLERFSLAGGTHHSALILGNHVSGVLTFGQILGFKCTVEQ